MDGERGERTSMPGDVTSSTECSYLYFRDYLEHGMRWRCVRLQMSQILWEARYLQFLVRCWEAQRGNRCHWQMCYVAKEQCGKFVLLATPTALMQSLEIGKNVGNVTIRGLKGESPNFNKKVA